MKLLENVKMYIYVRRTPEVPELKSCDTTTLLFSYSISNVNHFITLASQVIGMPLIEQRHM